MTASQITSTTFVAAAPAVVFAIVSDPRQHARIDGSGTVRDVVSGPDRLVLGSEFGMAMKLGRAYRITNRVVEHEPDRVIAWRHVGLHRWRYELEPVPGGTQVTETWDLSAYPGPLRAVLRALFGDRTQQAVDETLVRLRAAAEADATG
ncbi:MAG: SRPBCC family protein [Nocardioides sp.]|nr:SRPBCC family protein [Nocardioides sp.]